MKNCRRNILAAAAAATLTSIGPARIADAALTFTVLGNWDTQARKDAATAAMTNIVNRYNSYGNFTLNNDGNIEVFYNPGVPTAQSNYNGQIDFGGTYPNDRVAQHESNHWLGSGTTGNWTNRFVNAVWTGSKMNALAAQFDGDGAVVLQSGVHFYPYGLNYDTEVVNSDVLMRNIALMYAQRQDDGLGVQADPWSALVVHLRQSDALGTSSFNWFGGWDDNYYAHPNAAYFTGDFTIRTPLDTSNPGGTTPSFTFAGDSLMVNNTNGINGGLLFKGVGTSSILTFKNLILGGGYVRHASGAGDVFQLAGKVTLSGTPTIDAAQGDIKITANISGIGSLLKTGTHALTLTSANSYTGSTTITAGTLRLAPAAAVANYTFDAVLANTVVNNGTGGAPMNGALANGATIVAGGRFGKAVSLSGSASVDINNPIMNMGISGSWTVSAWVKTSTPGSSILTKSDGTGWTYGNTIFYLGDGSGQGSGGIPSGVRWAGGFFQGSSGAAAVNDNAWHLVTYVNSVGGYAIYVDGVAQPLSPGNSSFSVPDLGSVVRLGVSTNSVPADGTVNYNGLLDSVQFYDQALTPAQVAALYQGTSVGTLPATTDVTIAAGATLDVNGSTQQIVSVSGPVGSSVLLGAGRLSLSSATNSQFAGAISGAGGSLVKAGSGVLTLSGSNTYSGVTMIQAGKLVLIGNAKNPVLNNGGADVQGGRLILDYNDTGVAPDVKSILAAGFAQPTKFSTGQIRTSNPPDAARGLGWKDDATTKQETIAYTYYGDANLDGQVDVTDLGALATNWQTNNVWSGGDFDYSGFVDVTDLGALATNWQQGVGSPLAPSRLDEALASVGLGSVYVPEPTSIVLLDILLLTAWRAFAPVDGRRRESRRR